MPRKSIAGNETCGLEQLGQGRIPRGCRIIPTLQPEDGPPLGRTAMKFSIFFLLAGLAAISPFPDQILAQEQTLDLTELSLEQLMDIEVTSVSKREEKLSETTAAVFVITAEDISHHGFTTIPDALRTAPGIQVARINANTWAVSARGFNGEFANKLLVLMDGRSIYNPFYSGVYWDAYDIPMEDIERIEIIRGPGATLWGANAVNGVINIITKHSANTHGGLVKLASGTEEQAYTTARYGGDLSPDTHYRVSLKYSNRDNSVDPLGSEANDSWQSFRADFRLDGRPTPTDSWSILAGANKGRDHSTINTPSISPPYAIESNERDTFLGAHALGRWRHTFSDSSEATAQLYYDYMMREEAEFTAIDLTIQNIDLDFQHLLKLGQRQTIAWGLGARVSADEVQGKSDPIPFTTDSRTLHLLSGFVQDEIRLVPDRLRLTIGSKFEHNGYTGFEIQPSIRTLWTPAPNQTLWGAISRAVRIPSRGDRDVSQDLFVIPPGTPMNPTAAPALIYGEGNQDFKAEDLVAYEIGYRTSVGRRFLLDVALFHNSYKNLRTGNPGTFVFKEEAGVSYIWVPVSVTNTGEQETYGLELTVDGQLRHWWRLHSSYTYLHTETPTLDGASFDETLINEGSPRHSVYLWSSMGFGQRWDLDLGLRYVDELPSFDPELKMESYMTADARVGFRPQPGLELSIVGRDLLEKLHQESGTSGFTTISRTQVERSVYGAITWIF
jgi:iron complex outermembrane receptor protein